jgi:hypothetical protein
MEIFVQAVAGLLTLGVGGLIGWVWNINSRTTILETKEAAAVDLVAAREGSLRDLLELKFEGMNQQFVQMDKSNDQRLTRIERALNGYIRHHDRED